MHAFLNSPKNRGMTAADRCAERAGGIVLLAICIAILSTTRPAWAGSVQKPSAPDRAGRRDAAKAASVSELYVSPLGDDRWSGELREPNEAHDDGPFATLERARDAVREINKHDRADHGVTVWIRGGTYFRSRGFQLSSEDGGTAQRPVVYRAYAGEEVRFVGGRMVANFVPVTDQAVLDRLDPPARGKVLQADLWAMGVTDFGELSARGFHRKIAPSGLELFFRGNPMLLARWPKKGFASITAAPAGPEGGKFTLVDERMARWADAPDLWVHGYWSKDYADSYEKVKAIDLAKHEIATMPPHGVYGYTAGKRFYVLNCLEELDEPGEWYLDRRSGVLYFWPPQQVRDGDAVVSTLAEPMVTLRGASYVTLRGLRFECSRGAGAVIVGGSHNRIAGCTFDDLGTFAVSVGERTESLTDDLYANPLLDCHAGTDNGIISCEIVHTGEGGILLGGGDRATLTPGGNFATNNRIIDFDRWVRTYRPAILVHGVGNYVGHNVISDGPHVGILLKGNDHVVEYNALDHLCTETSDVGAFYMGRDFTERGNVVRFNLFTDIGAGGPPGAVVVAIYLDDCASGTLVFGNVVCRSYRGVLLGGGRDNSIDNNLFVDCNLAILMDARGLDWMKSYFDGTDRLLFDRLKLVHCDRPPFASRYPELAKLESDSPAIPKGNRIQRNVHSGGGFIDIPEGLGENVLTLHANYREGEPMLASPEKMDFNPKPESPVWKTGYKAIPVEKIGIQKDEYRNRKSEIRVPKSE
ncbi:MAG: putative pectin lyase [Phycisphaerales bacterium]|nr:putative pectin lyase [Phycisphaerales bacterium]